MPDGHLGRVAQTSTVAAECQTCKPDPTEVVCYVGLLGLANGDLVLWRLGPLARLAGRLVAMLGRKTAG